jgi:hypothetical protein
VQLAPPVSAVDAIAVVWNALPTAEQESAFRQLSELRLRRLAGTESEMAQYINSLRRIAEHADREDLNPDEYRAAYAELKTRGDETLIEFNKLVRYFGRWTRAKEALALSAATTTLKIEARFRSRMVRKVHLYREDSLRDALVRCGEELGHPPLIAEFEHWRHKQIELAKARGEDLWLPSASPYRRRHGSWEAALEYYGFSPDAIRARYDVRRGAY